jgi:DNA-binding CsgD family transcriptional regulator
MFTHAQEVADICRPLHLLGIDYFSHVKITNKKNFSALSLNPAFGEHYLNKKYYSADIHLANSKQLGKFVLWDSIEVLAETKQLNEDSAAFGVNHIFTIFDHTSSENNFYHFASNLKGKSINQEYLCHQDLLHQFIRYFHEAVSKSTALSNAYQFKLAIDEQAPGFKMQNSSDPPNIRLKQQFLEAIDSNSSRTSFHDAYHHISASLHTTLTRREMECLALTMLGKTAKFIAKELCLSHRTVENYLESIKDKLQVRTKPELIGKLIR